MKRIGILVIFWVLFCVGSSWGLDIEVYDDLGDGNSYIQFSNGVEVVVDVNGSFVSSYRGVFYEGFVTKRGFCVKKLGSSGRYKCEVEWESEVW